MEQRERIRMSEKAFTNIRSMLGALATAMNLINPEIEHHHEQTAYMAYSIAREMGLADDLVYLTVYAALLHDIGSVVVEEPASVAEIEQDARKYAHIGANMLRDLPRFDVIAGIIEYCQCNWTEIQACVCHETAECQQYAQLASVVHTADVVSSCLNPDKPVLNQVDFICKVVEHGRGTQFCPEAVDAVLRLKDLEFIWMDVVHNPSFLMIFTGEIRQISLQETVELTRFASRLIDYRSPFTAMHSAGVAASAKALAQLAGMSEEDCLKMEIAGNLHDIGKLSVPRAILEKPEKLTDEEFNVIKEHPYYTRLLLLRVDGFSEIADWAGFHHEKLNGQGYPFHYNESQLDLGSRIMAVADIFSAITEERPYRKGMSKEQALDVLHGNVERGAICGEIVDLLAEHYEEVDAARDAMSHAAGKRYFESMKYTPR